MTTEQMDATDHVFRKKSNKNNNDRELAAYHERTKRIESESYHRGYHTGWREGRVSVKKWLQERLDEV